MQRTFASSSTDDADDVQRAIHESLRVGAARIESDFSRATHESRERAGMKRCYICGAWTRNPIRSSTHRACPHSACRLKCLLKMETDHVDRIFEMDEMDERLRTQHAQLRIRAIPSQLTTVQMLALDLLVEINSRLLSSFLSLPRVRRMAVRNR